MQESFIAIFNKALEMNNAIASIRPLIFELATHGRIVEQIPQEEPISVLASQIASQMEDEKSNNQFRVDPIAPLNLDTLPEIPSSWIWVPLGNVVDYGSSKKLESAKIPGDAWLLDLEDIEKDTSRLIQKKRFRDNPSRSTKAAFSAGDVLYCKLRPYLNKVIVADTPGFCTTEIIPIRSFGLIEPAYLSLALRRPSFVAYANSKSYGMNLPRLSTADARKAPIPLPPLAEQKRIVAKVDELMGMCDELEAQQQERELRKSVLVRSSLSRFAESPTSENLGYLFHNSYDIPPSELRKSILTLAVQGKLVPQDPEDEPADVMLKRIEREKNRLSDSGELKADKKAWLNSSPNPPHDIPDSWSWVRIQEVFEISRGGSPRPAGDPRFFGGSIPWITVGEVTKDSNNYLTETATGLTEEGSKRSRFINPGDLLLTNSGATLGVPKISKIRGCINDGVAVLRLFHSFDFNEFGYLYLTHQTLAFRNVNRGMGQPNLNTPIIGGWFFPLPPLAEQRRIVAKVDQLMALVDELERQQAASREKASNLLDAIVHEMTSGE